MGQTAMQEMIKKLEEKRDMWKSDGKLSDRQIRGTYVIAILVAKELLEMEKQQIIDAGNSCAIKQHLHDEKVDKMSNAEAMVFTQTDNLTFGEQYYNETFNK
jgi:hypothetical protein